MSRMTRSERIVETVVRDGVSKPSVITDSVFSDAIRESSDPRRDDALSNSVVYLKRTTDHM